jgi:uncharacterized protein (TIGR03083 family)
MGGLDALTATGTPGALDVELAASPVELLVRQRARLADRLARLDASGWHRPTRCPLWDVADVVTHLGDATEWALAAIAGTDTPGPGSARGFDPSTTPHEHVLARRGQPPHQLLARLREETATLAERLRTHGEPVAPAVPWVAGLRYTPGLVGIHIFWDSWLHELDLDATLSDAGVPALAPCPIELDAAAAYGIFFTAAIAQLGLPPEHRLDRHVELGHLAYRLTIGSTLGLCRADPAAPTPGTRVLRGPALTTVEALAGRGELTDTAEGDAHAIAVMSGLGARMRASAEAATT